MNNKEYGVELNADISKFQDKLKKAQELANKTKETIEEPLRKIKVNGEEKKLKIQADTSALNKQLKETAEDFEKRMANVKPKIYDHRGFDPDAKMVKDLEDLYGNSEEENEYWKMFSNMKAPTMDYSSFWDGTDKSKEKVQELKNEIIELVDKYKELSKPKIGTLFQENDIKKAEEYKELIKEAVNELNQLTGKSYGIKGITDNFGELDEKTKDVDNDTNKTTITFAKFGNDISKSINQGINNLKRFSLSLFGIHSAYTAVSRAVRSYMAYDSEANARIQANWVALGAMFAPIVEKIVGWIQKLVAYINVFYKALTGKDFIKTALDKVKNKANATSKAVKGLNKELANFDEITNLNFDKGTDAQDFGIADALGELNEVELDPKIVKKIQDIAKTVKEWIEPLKNILKYWKEIITTIIIFKGIIEAIKFASLIKNLFDVGSNAKNAGDEVKNTSGSMGALGGAISLLIGSIALLIGKIKSEIDTQNERIEKMKDVREQMDLLKEAQDNLEEAIDNHDRALENLNKIQSETGLSGEELYKKVEEGTLSYKNMTPEMRETYKAYKELISTQKEEEEATHRVTKKNFDLAIANDKTGKTYNQLRDDIVKAYENGELSAEEASDSITRMSDGMSLHEQQVFKKDIPKAITEGMSPGRYKNDLDKMADLFSYHFEGIKNDILRRFSNIPGEIKRIFKYGLFGNKNGLFAELGINFGVNIGGLKFAKGNVAYGPTVAEFGEYAGARSNPEITAPQNIMKQTMIEALQEAMPQGSSRNGDTVLIVNGKELARATYNDFESERNRLGSSNVAIRRV